MDVECKRPGSVHDAKVFANSAVCKNMRTGNLQHTFYNILPDYESIPKYIIGDPTLLLTLYCMKEFRYCIENNPAGIYLLKVNNRNTWTRYEIYSELTMKTPERRQLGRCGVFIVNFEHISHLVLIFILLTLSR